MRPWDGIIGEDEQKAYRAAGFGRAQGMGTRPALLIIDIQYRTIGTEPRPFWDSVKEFPTSCGEVGWAAMGRVVPLLECFRRKGFPVLYPHVAPKVAGEGGRLAEKVPAIMTIPAKGYEFPAEIAPRPGDVLIPKKHPSAFFGTAMVSHLIDLNVDTLVMTGCTTSGCVRASTVDAFAYNFKVVVPEDAVYDRSRVSHSVNLFDMAEKYADVMPSAEVLKRIEALSPRATARAAE
jgi:nicotinamidase-related amidase